MKTPEPGMDSLQSLENLDIKVPKFLTIDSLDERKESIVFKGIHLDLNIKTIISNKEGKFEADFKINASTKIKKNVASINLAVVKNREGLFVAHVAVENADRDLKNFGLTLWKIARKLIEKISNEWKIPITHVVVRMPADGLSGSQWNKIFLPVLEEYKYIPKEHNFWERTYFPDKW